MPSTSPSFFLIEDISITGAKKVATVELLIDENIVDTKWKKSNKTFRTSLDPSKHNFMISDFTLRFRGHRSMFSKSTEVNVNDIPINLQRHFSGTNPTEKSQSVSGKYDDLTVTISFASELKTPDNTSSSNGLQPTTTLINHLCPRFRILVIGNTGVGKSTLINKVFGSGTEPAKESHMWAGKADIDYGHCPEKNSRLILHDSRGFEPAEKVHFDTVQKFINSRDKKAILGDRLHAVWLCLQIPPAGGPFFEAGIEKFLEQKKKGHLGTVPIIAVFTQYDNIIKQKKYEIACRPDWMERQDDVDEAAGKEAEEDVQARCIKPFQDQAGEDTPFVVVSKGDQESIEKLVKLTVEHVEKFVSNESYIVSAMAQQASPEVKIDGSIKVGKKKYWNGLASGTNFPGRNLKSCLEVIHIDIISVWNFQDPRHHLQSEQFRNMMYSLVTDIFETRNALAPIKTLSVGLSMVGSIAGLVSVLSGPAAPIVIPIAATTVLAVWLYEVYKQTDATISRFMAYIVDLTLVMQNLFWIVENVEGDRLITIRMVKLALKSYRDSKVISAVHYNITEFVRNAGPAARANRDNVFDKIVELIEENRISSTEMRSRIGELGLQNIDLRNDDEPWVGGD